MKNPLICIEGTEGAEFLCRPNRFICRVKPDSAQGEVLAHVADPGRLRELLYEGNRVLVKKAASLRGRKTGYSLVAAIRNGEWVLINTTYHRPVADSILSTPGISPFGELAGFRAEVVPEGKRSRFDYRLTLADGSAMWLEVKGCTLCEGSTALFPDAPTTRGVRHLEELTGLCRSGERAAVMFLVFSSGAEHFRANRETDPGFAGALVKAVDTGVAVRAVRLHFDGRQVMYAGELPVCA